MRNHDQQVMEDTTLYELINRATAVSFRSALRSLDDLPPSTIRLRSERHENTFLHLLVLKLKELHDNNAGSVTPAIALIYRLALRGCDMNAQNNAGNTCLHMACYRPHSETCVQHLVRLGVDPGILNNSGFRVIHDNENHRAWMVYGQKAAKCSIWNAVAREDRDLMDIYLKSWCRVNTRRRRKTLIDVGYETGNYAIVQHLLNYKNTNELVCAAMACDTATVSSLLKLKSDKCDLGTHDHSSCVPKPLIAEVKMVGPAGAEIVDLLQKFEATDDSEYIDRMVAISTEFENSKFYTCVEQYTEESLCSAWNEVNDKKVRLSLRGPHEGTYLHHVVHKYANSEDNYLNRLLVRLMYKLCLDGIDVHARNDAGETALVAAYKSPPDRILLEHLIQLGVDASIRSQQGLCLSINAFATHGELYLSRQKDRKYLPGLWVAVEDNDINRVRHCLSQLCRVNVRKGGRSLVEHAKDMGFHDIANLLESRYHHSEFVTAAMACDIQKMKHHIAMGNGAAKVNVCYHHYFAGFTDNWRTEYVVRPLIVNVAEYATAEVASYLIEFGAKLQYQYEECAPCGPAAFWAFRDHIKSEITLAISHHADVLLRDELGATLLHWAVRKRESSLTEKVATMKVLLDRGINVAARDLCGMTARDYAAKEDQESSKVLCQVIDDHVLGACYMGDYDAIEQLILDGYDHIADIVGTPRHKTAKELAYLRYHKELMELLDEIPKYQTEIRQLHSGVLNNNMECFVRLASEKRVAWGLDDCGRNLLHIAVLFERHDLVAAICEQFPQMIFRQDSLLRTPVHYAVCITDQRATLSIISTSNSVDMTIRDANNLSTLDYIEQMERPTPIAMKTRGRRVHNYMVRNLLEIEKMKIPEYVIQMQEAEEDAHRSHDDVCVDEKNATE